MGAKETLCSREMATRLAAVITMLPDWPNVKFVALGADGIVERACLGKIYVDMGTVCATVAAKPREAAPRKASEYWMHPVSGDDIGAEKGLFSSWLVLMRRTLNEVLPTLQVFGENIVLCRGMALGRR